MKASIPNRRSRIGQRNIIRKDLPKEFLLDVYHQILQLPWTKLLLSFFSTFIIINLIFATLYQIDSSGITNHSGRFLDSFFFSVQTFSTIGFGSLAPISLFSNILVTLEAMLGLICMALMTGIIFSKFSKATAKVLFSNQILISTFNGVPTLIFRVANARTNQIINATVNVTHLQDIQTQEGQNFREFKVLKLAKNTTPVFYLSMTVMHTIDESSPLFGITSENIANGDRELVVNISGLDGTFAHTIHSQFSYKAIDIVFGGKYADILSKDSSGTRIIDYSNFHKIIN